MKINPLTAIDFYKADHRRQYPKGTQFVYSNFTPRSSNIFKNVYGDNFDDRVVFFGLQYFIKDFLINTWNEEFFKKPKDEVVAAYKRRMDCALGPEAISVEHIAELHDHGTLPIQIKALPEGALVNEKIPVLTMVNTDPKFFWLTNYLESVMSCYLWKPMTSATIARNYRILLDEFAKETGSDPELVQFQAHDFSFRGMSGLEDAACSGAGHLVSFSGTDTVPAIDFMEEYYGADVTKELVGASVPATEHSVMCMGSKEGEKETYKRLITEVYPSGIVSIVSDTWDFWKVVTEFMLEFKDLVLARDGKVVIRPDSGDPVKILCGDPEAKKGSPEYKGAVECLWDIYGGSVTDKGYKLLDPHVGLIYGDSITLQRAKTILTNLKQKGFASGNVVFGVGSFTYQHTTRDVFGFAMKATYGVVDGIGPVSIFKDPVTDDGVKKSAKGLLQVVHDGASYVVRDEVTSNEETQGDLKVVFKDGKLLIEHTLAEIRKRVLDK